MITAPGVYDITAEEYHRDPCPKPSLSSSIAKILMTETPEHAWTQHPRLNQEFERDDEDKFDIGNAAHAMMLHDDRLFEVFDFTDWRTKEARERKDQARAHGNIPLLREQFERVQTMVDAGRGQLLGHEDATFAFTKGKPEQTLVWKEGDIWCRARLDWLYDTGDVFDDYKTTTSADPDTWGRICFSLGHDVQAAFYLRGIRNLGLSKHPHFRFIVQEVEGPFALCVMELDETALALAERRVQQSIQKWAYCLHNNTWPGYPAHTVTIHAPPWHENQMMERETRDAAIERHVGKSLLEAGLKFQAPL